MIYEEATKTAITWPAEGGASVVDILGRLFHFGQRARRCRTPDGGGLVGGYEPDPYLVKHWTRACLVRLVDSGVELGSLTLEELAQWMPDQSGHCGPVLGFSAQAIQQRFGVSAVRLSMFACLANKIPDHINKAKLLAIKDGDAYRALSDYEFKHSEVDIDQYWPPGPCELVNLFNEAGLL